MKTISSFSSKLLAFTLALMASVSTFAYDFQSGYLFYNILPDGTVAVTSETYGIPYDYLPNSLVIPSEVNGYNGETYVVTEIANYAFSGCNMLDTLVIPNTIKKIGMYAFTGCTKLVYISFPESIEDILGGALYECAWYNNQPDGLIYIGNLLYRYKGTAPTGIIVVKDGTKAILDFTFSNQPNIQSVVLPESVTSIHIQAFGDCPNLESVVLPSKLEAIEDHTFQYCEKLTNIKLPDALKLIGKNAFIGCTNLTKLTLPSSVQIIEDEAFANCTSLTEVTCYATIPPVRGDVVSDSPSDWFFAGVDVAKIPLYVPTESIDLYKKAEQWMFFNPILPIEPTTDYKSQWCDTWNVMWFDGLFFDETASTSQYRLGKDTVIGNYTYSKFTSRTSVRFTNDRKVYVYYEGFDDNDPYSEDLPTGEYLAYDFSAQVGDTLEVFSGVTYNTKTYKCVVYDVQTDPETNLRTIMLHPLRVVDGNGNVEVSSEEITWIEGVGSPRGFLIGTTLPGGGLYALLCAYKGDELKYTGSLYDEYGCEYNATEQNPADLFPTLWGLQRTEVEFHTDGAGAPSLVSFNEYTPTFVNGKWYLYDGRNYLREENNQVLLYSPEFEIYEDVVLYDWTLEIGDTLPFTIRPFDDDKSRGAVFRVTDVSTITLLDGKEYKKWTLACGIEYIEGIGAINGEGFGNYFCIQHTAHPATYIDTRLVCASRNGKLLYQMDNAEMERLGTECLCEVEKKWSDTWCDTWNVLDLKYRTIKYTTKEDFETWRYYLAQDTIINNYTYTAVTRQTTKVPEGVYPFTIPEPEYVAAVRFTDDRKVYIYYDNTEYLLYDFNVQPGDELTVFAGINHYHSHHTNTIRVAEVERYPGIYPFGTEISLSVFPDFYGDERPACFGVTKWVEGVGDLCGFITGADCGLSEYQTALLCAYKDGNTEYTTENEEYAEYGCEYNSGENKEYILTLPGLQRTVYDEFCGEAEIGAVYTGKQTFDKIFFENDKPYILCNGYLLREEDNKILIYSQLLNKDLVLYDFTLEVGDSLPALYIDYHARNAMDWIPYNLDVVDYNKDFDGTIYPADTFVVTDISSVTLLDGKEYKKWTFDNGMEYVEGIGMYGGHRNGNFFGLIQEIVVPCHIGTHLVCVSKNNKLLYQMDDAEMERLGTECLCETTPSYKSQWCDTWNVLWFDGMRFDETASTSQYRLGKDTIIGDYTYRKFTSRTSVRFTNDRKVYVYYEGFDDNDPYTVDLPTGEYLAYDFSAQVGDTLEVFSGVGTYSTYSCVVDDVETAPSPCVVDDVQADLKTFPLIIKLRPLCDVDGEGNMEISSEEITWIEGVGSPEGFLISSLPCGWGGGGTFALLCAYKGDELKYTGSLYDEYGCEYNANDPQLPLVEWCNQWNILAHGYLGPQEPLYGAKTTIYQLGADTIINHLRYKQLTRYASDDVNQTKTYVGAIRFTKNNRQVYFYYNNAEYLLYDFKAQVGDTLEVFAGIDNYRDHKTYKHVVTNKEPIQDEQCKVTLDVFVSQEHDGEIIHEEKFTSIWIEGVGSPDGIVHNCATLREGNVVTDVLCAYVDDRRMYRTPYPDYRILSCEYNEGDFIEGAFPMLSGLQRTICNEYCEDSKTSLQKFEDIRFEHDQPYIYCASAFLIREENNKILIYSHSLDKDLVLYDFTLEVGDSLPRLYLDESAEKDLYWIDYSIMNVVDYHKDLEGNILPADTLIVTDVSTITLLDGKEHKKWTFNNGMEYVEGIGSYGNNMQFSDFFQLIGNMAVPVSLHGTHLVCVSKNNKLLYQMDDAEMERLGTECLCAYDSGHRKDNAKDGQIGGRPTPTQWNQLEVVLREMDNNHTILQAETFSYTLEDISQQVNNKTYFQLARQSTKDTATTKSVVGALHFGKDEDNRVYFLRDGVEYVLYDFTAEPGDTVEIFAGINNYPQETTYTHVVTGKDTLENGACRMLLEVVFPDETNTTAENAEKVWLAGLGSVDGIVHNAAKRASNAHAAPSRSADSNETESSVMLCAWREDSCLYTTDHPDYDSFGCVYNQDPTSVEDTHSLLPMTNCQKIIRNEQLLILHEGKTYNVLGVQIK